MSILLTCQLKFYNRTTDRTNHLVIPLTHTPLKILRRSHHKIKLKSKNIYRQVINLTVIYNTDRF